MDQTRGASIEGNKVERVYDIATDSDRNVYVVSPIGVYDLDVDGHPKEFYGSPGSSIGDYVLASFACDGSYRWSKVIGGRGYEGAPYIEMDGNDNIYLVGKFGSCTSGQDNPPRPPRIENDTILNVQYPSSCSLLFISKFDQEGNMLWFHRPMPETEVSLAYTQAGTGNLASDPNGNAYWLVRIPPGSFADGAFVNTMDGSNWFVFKYNPVGDFLSATYVDIQTSMGSTALSLKMYHNPYNGYFYFTGNRYNDTAVVGGETVTGGLYLACFDPQGVFQWMRQNTYTTGAGGSRIYALDFDSQNNIYLGGYFIGFNYDTFLGYSIAEELIPGFVMKTNPTAQGYIWASHHNKDSNTGAINLEDGVLTFTSYGYDVDFTWGDQTIYINEFGTGSEVLLASFDKDTGDCIGLDFIQGDPGHQDNGTALASDANGDILVGGSFHHMLYDVNGVPVINGTPAATDFFIAKYASGPCEEMSVEEVGKTDIEIYPNPVAEKLYVSVKGETTYRLYDLLGKLVQEGTLKNAQNSIAVENLPVGMYILELEDLNGNVEVQKVVKE